LKYDHVHTVPNHHREVSPLKLRKAHTFRSLALLYVASLSQSNSPKTIETRIHHLDDHLLDHFGCHEIAALTPHSVEKFIFRMEGAGWSDKHIQACLVTFRACMKYGADLLWPLDARLRKPVAVDNVCLTADTPVMASDEFHDLYQNLVQDITSNLYH
jgi:hypothetical protein